jgi:hypothetical protein
MRNRAKFRVKCFARRARARRQCRFTFPYGTFQQTTRGDSLQASCC